MRPWTSCLIVHEESAPGSVVLVRERCRMPETVFIDANLLRDGFAERQRSFNVLVNTQKNLKLIMKEGTSYKNELAV